MQAIHFLNYQISSFVKMSNFSVIQSHTSIILVEYDIMTQATRLIHNANLINLLYKAANSSIILVVYNIMYDPHVALQCVLKNQLGSQIMHISGHKFVILVEHDAIKLGIQEGTIL